MCSHEWTVVGCVTVCVKCGLTRLKDGRIMFDKKLPNYKPNTKKNRRKK